MSQASEAKHRKSSFGNQVGTPAKNELDPSIFKRKGRDLMFSGVAKKQSGPSEVPTLLKICQQALHKHIDRLSEFKDDLTYKMLSPVFERCTIDQLKRVSEKNPCLQNDMNPIWEQHVKKAFPTAKKMKRESWFMVYNRLGLEQDERLKEITAKINRRKSEAAPIRRTIMSSIAISPKVQNKQAGSFLSISTTREVVKPGSKKQPGGSNQAKAPKRGALMTMSMKMFKKMRR